MDLSGRWQAIEADEDLRRTFPDPGLDERDWESVDVPLHWRSHAAFAASDGPLLYRRHFGTPAATAEPGPGGRRHWLVLDGLFYQGDVWLDGSYVGDTEGYFFPHTFEVTEAVEARREHVLAVEVACSPQSDRTAKRNITGVFQHWDCLDPDWNPGGIWRPVRLEETGPVRINRLRVVCPEAPAGGPRLDISAELDAVEAMTVELSTVAGIATEFKEEHRLSAGRNRVNWRVTVNQPLLWWPHALGEQYRYDVVVEVTPLDGVVSHRRMVRTGLRQIRMKRWVVSVNGERLFLKGANIRPTRMALGEATVDDFERDVLLAKAAGLDLLRVHGHVSRPELYDAADRHGVLVWQDLPLQWGYARGVRKQAVRQAAEAVDLLAHHPSVALWCAHNEPMTLDVEPGTPLEPNGVASRAFAKQELPTWNKTVLDTSVRRSLEKADGSRPVVPHSGVLPHPGSLGTDSHLYFGWYWGDERDFPRLLAAWPRLARFVSEFGAQAVPVDTAFMEPERWPDLDWPRLERTHDLQLQFMTQNGLDPAAHATFAEWAAATQAYQAMLVKHHVETLRRLKYRPTGGFCQFMLADAHPAVTWSVLDHALNPKTGYVALAAACAPVVVVADRPDASYAPGTPIVLDVHVVSDLRVAVEGAQVTARLSWPGGDETWRWEGDVGADVCVRVGTVQAITPDAEGPLELELTLESTMAKASNTYRSQVRSS